MKLLALDLSSNVGHAILERGRVPLFGTLRLVGDRATMLGRFGVWLDEFHMVHGFDSVAWERPLITPRDTVDKLEILYGLVGIAYAFAGARKLPHLEVTVQQVKFALTGKSNADKAEMVAAAMQVMNWKVANDHEADAGGVGIHAMGILNPRTVAA